MIKLSTSIKSLIKENNFSSNFLLGYIELKWKEIVGDKIANATTVQKIETTTIYIKCKNPAWKNELSFYKKEILLKIQKETNKIDKIIII